VTITSNNTAVIPNQTIPVTAGQTDFPHSSFNVSTNAVTQNTTVVMTASFGPYSSGSATLTVTPPATGAPASIAMVSGSGQSAIVGSNFPNPLVVVVKDASSNPVNGTMVTFAGTGVSFPNGATAVTNSSGDASVVAAPTQSGSLTVTASVSGVGTSATFPETGNQAGGTLASITNYSSANYDQHTNANLTVAATAPVVVQLSSSDPSIVYVPTTVTIATGQTSRQTGSLLGSLWGQSPLTKSATLSATYNGVTINLTRDFRTVDINSFACGTCTVQGGQPLRSHWDSSAWSRTEVPRCKSTPTTRRYFRTRASSCFRGQTAFLLWASPTTFRQPPRSR
jgi:hypothetical protein